MERRKTGTDQNNTTYDPSDFIKKHALVQEIDSKATLTDKGERVFLGLQKSLGQSSPSSSGTPL
jgi:hypothetical protein